MKQGKGSMVSLLSVNQSILVKHDFGRGEKVYFGILPFLLQTPSSTSSSGPTFNMGIWDSGSGDWHLDLQQWMVSDFLTCYCFVLRTFAFIINLVLHCNFVMLMTYLNHIVIDIFEASP